MRPAQHPGAATASYGSSYRIKTQFLQSALRMLKSEDLVIPFPERDPHSGKIFDAEDTARHAVSALKCVFFK